MKQNIAYYTDEFEKQYRIYVRGIWGYHPRTETEKEYFEKFLKQDTLDKRKHALAFHLDELKRQVYAEFTPLIKKILDLLISIIQWWRKR